MKTSIRIRHSNGRMDIYGPGDILAVPTVPPLAGAVRVLKPVQRSPLEAALIMGICEDCQWNVGWVCEHIGCKPCSQRKAGGLKEFIKNSGFKCAANKW
jgi:hypothetical protein